MKTTITKRDKYPDVVKGIAIILVVLGHCIQEGNGALFSANQLYWQDKLYQLIYSFHMPLFMLIAGFYAYPSIRKCTTLRDRLRLLGRRCTGYILPVFVWTFLEYLRGYLNSVRGGYAWLAPGEIVPSFFKYFITNLWFLWGILFCFLVVWLMHFYFHDSPVIYALGFLMMFIIPDGYNLGVYKYMLPYYLLSFYMHLSMAEPEYKGLLGNLLKRSCEMYTALEIRRKCITLAAGLLAFLLLFLFYNENSFIYLSGYSLYKGNALRQLIRDIYRFVIGFAGSINVLMFVSLFRKELDRAVFRILAGLGQNSLGIYIISGYLILLVMKKYTDPLSPSLPRVAVETIVITLLSFAITRILALTPIRRLVGK